MNDRKQNNSEWVIDEFTEWVDKAIDSVNDLCDKSDVCSAEYTRLLEKSRTLQMVKGKLEELKFE